MRTALAHSLLIIAVAALLCLPCLQVGIPAGYDADYHTAYQYHFSRQFWEGDLYPRWLTGANKGYGSPIFLIQYPLPYFVTALLRPVTSFSPDATREARELGVFLFLVVAGAGLTARVWFRHHCRPLAATLGALIYIALPYTLGQSLYLRTGLGELTALVWVPLAFAFCDTLRLQPRAVSMLGLVFALLLLTHLTSAVLFLPVLCGYAMVAARAADVSPRQCLTSFLLAIALGIGAAAVYVLPFVAYRHLFDLNAQQALMPSFELGRWFSYVTSSAVSRRFVVPALIGTAGFSLVVALYIWRAGGSLLGRLGMVATLGLGVAVLVPDVGPWLIRGSGLGVTSFETAGDFSARMLFTGLLTVALGFLAYSALKNAVTRREELLLVVAASAFVLMLPWSAPLWQARPELANIQFPFRLGSLLTVAVAGLFAVALETCLWRRGRREGEQTLLVLSVAALAVIGAGSFAWRVPERFRSPDTAHLATARNVDNMIRAYVSPPHVAELAKALGTAADSFEVALTPSDGSVQAQCIGGGSATTVPVTPRLVRVSTQCPGEGRVRIGQLYSPLWRAVPLTPSSTPPVLGSSGDGLMEVTVGPGPRTFELVFDGRWPEQGGLLVTWASIGATVGTSAFLSRRGRIRTTHVNAQPTRV